MSNNINIKKKNWLLPLVLSIAFFMENMDANIITTSLPDIAQAVNTNPVTLKLAMTSYLISLSVFIPISGWIVDNFTAKLTFSYSIIIFMIGSILCALSLSLSFFVFARFLQGIGGAMMVPVARLVILRSTPKEDLVEALSWFTIPALVGPLVGPPIGGFITTYFSWHWIFLINIPIGIFALICATVFMPKDEELFPSKLDVKGFFLSAIALSFFIFGASIISQPNLPKIYGFFLTITGIICGFIYYKHAKIIKNPVLSIDIFENKTFTKSIIGGSIFRLGIGAIPFLLPLMFQLCFKMSAITSGCLVFITAAGAIFLKTFIKYIFNKFHFYKLLIFGTIISSILTAIYGLFTATTPYWLLLSILFVSGFLRSMCFTTMNSLGFSEINRKDMSQASPIQAVATQASLALGVAIAGIILETFASFHNGTNTLSDFHYAFYIISFCSVCSVFIFATFDKNVGSSLTTKK